MAILYTKLEHFFVWKLSYIQTLNFKWFFKCWTTFPRWSLFSIILITWRNYRLTFIYWHLNTVAWSKRLTMSMFKRCHPIFASSFSRPQVLFKVGNPHSSSKIAGALQSPKSLMLCTLWLAKIFKLIHFDISAFRSRSTVSN